MNPEPTLVIGNTNYSSWSMRPWVALRARARARALCAEMHAGFRALRGAMPMNLSRRYPRKGMNPEVAKDIARISAQWTQTRERFGADGRCLFGAFCAPMPTTRRSPPALPPTGCSSRARRTPTSKRCLSTRAVTEWTAAALEETGFYAPDEPYASGAPG